MAFSKLELALGALVGLDLAAPGTTRKIAAKLVLGTAARAPAIATGVASLPGAPGALGAGLGYGILASGVGQEVVGLRPDLTYDPQSLVAEHARQQRLGLERYVQDTLALAPYRRKKRMSKFNQAVKKGMAIVKASPSYGKRGVINNSKKAFAAVTKTVSKVRRGQKKPKRGDAALKKVWNMAAKLVQVGDFKKLPKKKKGRGPAKRRTAVPSWVNLPRGGR